MGIYSYLSDEELAVEIGLYRDARREILLPGGGGAGAVKRITDGDRTMEYTRANLRDLDTELERLLAEQARRANGGCGGRAIPVEFT